MSAYQAYQIAKVLELKSFDALFPKLESVSENTGIHIQSYGDLSEKQRKQTDDLIASIEL